MALPQNLWVAGPGALPQTPGFFEAWAPVSEGVRNKGFWSLKAVHAAETGLAKPTRKIPEPLAKANLETAWVRNP